MKRLTTEAYDDAIHFWVAADLNTDHEYGSIFNREASLRKQLVYQIHVDLKENPNYSDYFWYFGSDSSTITLMVRIHHHQVLCQLNLSDFDFALNIDSIEEWKTEFVVSIQEGVAHEPN